MYFENRINVVIMHRIRVKSYLIDGKSIGSNPQHGGTALRAISRFRWSRPSYCAWSFDVTKMQLFASYK